MLILPTVNTYTDPVPAYSGITPQHPIKGELPLEEQVSAFYYVKDLLFYVPFSWFGFTHNKVLSGGWELWLTDEPDGQGNVFFHHKVQFRASITAIVDPFFGSIGMAVWQPLDQTWSPGDNPANRPITTDIVDGVTIDPDEAWKFIDVSIPTPFVEFGTTIFDPTAVVSTGGIYLTGKWISPRYLTTMIPPMYMDNLDNWPVGLLDTAAWSFAFKAGFASIDSSLDQFNGLLHAYTWNRQATISTGYTPYTHLQKRAYVVGGTDASINEDRYGQLWFMVQEPDGYHNYMSQDGGRTIARPEHHLVWPRGVTMGRTIIMPDQVQLSMAVDGFDLMAKNSADDWAAAQLIGRLPKKQAVTPVVDQHGKILAIGETGVLFTSTSNGRAWNARQPEPTVRQQQQEDGVIVIDSNNP